MVFWPSLPSICRLPVVNVWCFDLLYLVYVDFLLSMYGVLTFFTCRLPVVNVWCFELLYLVYVDFLLSMYGVLTFFTCRLPVVNVWCFDLLYLVYVDFLLSMYGVLTIFAWYMYTSCCQCMVFWPPLPSIRRLPVVNVWCFDLLYL